MPRVQPLYWGVSRIVHTKTTASKSFNRLLITSSRKPAFQTPCVYQTQRFATMAPQLDSYFKQYVYMHKVGKWRELTSFCRVDKLSEAFIERMLLICL